MRMHNLSCLKKEVIGIMTALKDSQYSTEKAFDEKLNNMSFRDLLVLGAEWGYQEPLAEKVAKDTVQMSFQEYMGMINSKNEAELWDYLADTCKVINDAVETHGVEANKFLVELSQSIKAKVIRQMNEEASKLPSQKGV